MSKTDDAKSNKMKILTSNTKIKLKSITNVEKILKTISNQVEELKDESLLQSDTKNNKNIEALLKCPITKELFIEPVTIQQCGHTFERYALKKYYENNNKCPLCNNKISILDIYHTDINYTIQNIIDEFYPSYRIEKKKTIERDDMIMWLPSNFTNLCALKNKEKLKNILNKLNEKIIMMAENGQYVCSQKCEGEWDDIFFDMIDNNYILNNVREKLAQVGMILDFKVRKGDFLMQRGDESISYKKSFSKFSIRACEFKLDIDIEEEDYDEEEY